MSGSEPRERVNEHLARSLLGGDPWLTTANWRVDERHGEKCQVFFVVAPDGLCYYFHQPLADE